MTGPRLDGEIDVRSGRGTVGYHSWRKQLVRRTIVVVVGFAIAFWVVQCAQDWLMQP